MKDNSGKIILALLAGASAGVVAGILMAPETGEATRGNLKKSASKLGQDLESKLAASMEQLQTLSTSASALLGKISGGGSDGDVVNKGSNTKATSHLDNNPTGGNLEAAGETAGSAGSDSSSANKGGKGKSTTGSKGSSTGSGGGSNATA